MPSVTLAESAKLSQDKLIMGIILTIIVVDRFFDVLPFEGLEGNALAYNRENAAGDVEMLGVGGTISAKAAATFTQVTSALTTIIGDAEVNGLIQATRSNKQDQTGVQIASKARAAARQYRDQYINGDGTGDNMSGLMTLTPAGQQLTAGVNGDALSFAILDDLIDLVTDKDGQVDYLMFHRRTVRSYKALLRGLGGANINEVVTLPSGKQVPSYSGIPIFANDNLPTDITQGTTTDATAIFAGTLDDGSNKFGIAGMTAKESAGIVVERVGVHQSKDETIWRVKWYSGLAMFSELGIGQHPAITN